MPYLDGLLLMTIILYFVYETMLLNFIPVDIMNEYILPLMIVFAPVLYYIFFKVKYRNNWVEALSQENKIAAFFVSSSGLRISRIVTLLLLVVLWLSGMLYEIEMEHSLRNWHNWIGIPSMATIITLWTIIRNRKPSLKGLKLSPEQMTKLSRFECEECKTVQQYLKTKRTWGLVLIISFLLFIQQVDFNDKFLTLLQHFTLISAYIKIIVNRQVKREIKKFLA